MRGANMCEQYQQEEIPKLFDQLVLLLKGFYYEGMPLEDLAHRLRTQSAQFVVILNSIQRN